MICGSCGRRCDPKRSFCTHCGSSVFVDEGATSTFSASPVSQSSSVSATSRQLQGLQRSATSIFSASPVSRSSSVSATTRQLRALQRSATSSLDPTAVVRRAQALKAPLPSFSLGPLIRFAVFVALLWTAANWLLDIPEVLSLKDRFKHGGISDDDMRSAGDAIQARIDALLGRAPAPVAPPVSMTAERPVAVPAPRNQRPDAIVLPALETARLPPGVSLPGDGVTLPRMLRQVKPEYTPEALRAKIEGTVLLQAVVRTNGVAADIAVVRSLDRRFGLDQQAIAAVRQWRFAPGERLGQPVPVLVRIEISFSTR